MKQGEPVLRDLKLKIHSLGFPGGSVAKNPPANAGDMCLIQEDPGRSSKIQHAAEKPSPYTTTLEPVLESPGAATAEPTGRNC